MFLTFLIDELLLDHQGLPDLHECVSHPDLKKVQEKSQFDAKRWEEMFYAEQTRKRDSVPKISLFLVPLEQREREKAKREIWESDYDECF